MTDNRQLTTLKNMVFVVGNSRSGTTMMGRILGKHLSVYTFGELHFFGQLCAPPFSSAVGKKEIEKLASQLFCIQREGYRTYGNPRRFLSEAQTFLGGLTIYPDTSAMLFEAFLRHEAAENDRTIPCDQTPRNVFYIADILELYPDSRVINMIRDPRDVLLSQKRKWKRRFLGGSDMPMKETLRDWMNYHPITISHIWRTAVSAADQFAQHERVVSVYFEELLTHPEETVKCLCDFVGINYTNEMLQVPQVRLFCRRRSTATIRYQSVSSTQLAGRGTQFGRNLLQPKDKCSPYEETQLQSHLNTT